MVLSALKGILPSAKSLRTIGSSAGGNSNNLSLPQ
jgi:hypothetical protein